MDFERPSVADILHGLESNVPLLQVVVGPRQVGKSTAALQIEKRLGWPSHAASADSALPHPPEWIETQWHLARLQATGGRSLRILDELQTVNKPALLRHLFALAATFPAQILSYTKMLGQLQDAGNTTTLAHYLELLGSAFLASGLELFSRGSSARTG